MTKAEAKMIAEELTYACATEFKMLGQRIARGDTPGSCMRHISLYMKDAQAEGLSHDQAWAAMLKGKKLARTL